MTNDNSSINVARIMVTVRGLITKSGDFEQPF